MVGLFKNPWFDYRPISFEIKYYDVTRGPSIDVVNAVFIIAEHWVRTGSIVFKLIGLYRFHGTFFHLLARILLSSC